VESMWTPGTFIFGRNTAKFMCVVHLEFMWIPGGVQLNHVNKVDSTMFIQHVESIHLNSTWKRLIFNLI
jgi:hypothetical protein